MSQPIQITKSQFSALMVRLRACYPGKISDDDLWMANVARYFEELSRFSADILAKAFERAWREHPVFFPTLGELEIGCKIAEKETVIKRPALPLPRHDHSAETQAAKERARAYIDSVLGGADTFVGVPTNPPSAQKAI